MTCNREEGASPFGGDKTLGHCLAEGLLTRPEVEAVALNFLGDSAPMYVKPGICAMMPTLADLPLALREAMIEIALLARE